MIIVIGSSQYSHTEENPFTAGERVTMIQLALREAGVDPARYCIIPVPDVHVHNVWVSHVRAQVPNFDSVYSNEALTVRLFKEAGFKVERIPYFNREVNSATEVRRRILSGGDWESLLPKSVLKYLKEIDGARRILDLSKEDKPPTPASS